MDDREVVAAIAAGDPTGIALAYDRYAAPLYGYCHWMLRQPADATEALRDTFITAVATLGDLPEPPKLRPWLYAVARNECQRRLRMATAPHAREPHEANRPTDVSQPAAAVAQPIDADDELTDATLRFAAIREPANTADELTEVMQPFPPLRERGNADDELTDATLRFPAIRERASAANDITDVNGATKQADLATMRPPAELPPELREQILRMCSSAPQDLVAYRQPAVRRARSIWSTRFLPTTRRLTRNRTEGNPRVATATIILMVWIAALWVVSMTLLIFG